MPVAEFPAGPVEVGVVGDGSGLAARPLDDQGGDPALALSRLEGLLQRVDIAGTDADDVAEVLLRESLGLEGPGVGDLHVVDEFVGPAVVGAADPDELGFPV